MANREYKIELEDDAWWYIEIRPNVRQAREIDAIIKAHEDDPEQLPPDQPNADDELLALLTTRWSFDEEISLETIMGRQIDHMIEAMFVLADEVVPFLERSTQRLTARNYLQLSQGDESSKATKT